MLSRIVHALFKTFLAIVISLIVLFILAVGGGYAAKLFATQLPQQQEVQHVETN